MKFVKGVLTFGECFSYFVGKRFEFFLKNVFKKCFRTVPLATGVYVLSYGGLAKSKTLKTCKCRTGHFGGTHTI